MAAGPGGAAAPNDDGGAENRGRAERRRRPQDPAAGTSAGAGRGSHARRWRHRLGGRPARALRRRGPTGTGAAVGRRRRSGRPEGDGGDEPSGQMSRAVGVTGQNEEALYELASAPRSMAPSSAPRFVAELGAKICGAEPPATLDAYPDLGAMTGGVETCNLGATICGAEVQGPEMQIVSKRV